MKAPESSRPVPGHILSQAGHGAVLPATLPAATPLATREPVDPLATTQVLAVPAVPRPAVDTARPPTDADMPLWVLLLALTALVFPALAALRVVARGTRRLAERWPPLRALGVVLLALAAGASSYVAVRHNLHTRAQTAPQTLPLALPSVPQSVPAPSAPFPATPAGRAAFVRTMVTVLQRKGLTRRQALLFAAHLARETGWGRWVRGNNFGNVKTGRRWTGPSFSMRDARGFEGQYRAWPTLEQGVESNLALVRDSARYRKAWKLLRAGDVRWYGQLGLDGYYEGPTGHARDGSRFHTEHDLSTVMGAQQEYEGIVSLAAQYDAAEAS